MARKATELTDEQIGVLADRKINQSVGIGSSKLAKEHERVLNYYSGTYPKQQHSGSASYISTDVYDAIESMKAQLLEAFGSGNDILSFRLQGPQDMTVDAETAQCNDILFNQNDGFTILQDVIDDALKARVGILAANWEEEKELVDETFEDQDEMTVQGMMVQEDIEELEADLDEETGTYSGTLSRVGKDNSGVKLENVAPEEFGIESQAKSLFDAFHYRRTLKTKEELRDMGLPVKKLKNVPPDAKNLQERATETDKRHESADTGMRSTDEDDDRYVVYDCYWRFKKVKGSKPRLYKVIFVGGKVLDCQEVDRSPFHVFTPLRIAHAFFGNNYGQRVVPTQNARTVLTRGILDHVSTTINPRYTVLQGGLTNPREMLANRQGGLVNISREGAVQPLLQAPLNPFVFQTLAELKANSEQTTGISALSQGLNKDAISSQNSEGMVQNLVDLSQVRQRVIARNFGRGFLVPLFVDIHKLSRENDKRPAEIEVDGQWVKTVPAEWPERKTAEVVLHLGQSARDAEAMKITNMVSMAKQDPFLARSMGDHGTYKAAQHVARLTGVKIFSQLFSPPEGERPPVTPPPGPDPEMELKMAEMKSKVEIANLKLSEAQMKMQVIQLQAAADKQQAEFDQRFAGLEYQLKQAESHRKDMQVANEIDVSQRELQIVEAAPAIEPTKAIVSPNS